MLLLAVAAAALLATVFLVIRDPSSSMDQPTPTVAVPTATAPSDTMTSRPPTGEPTIPPTSGPTGVSAGVLPPLPHGPTGPAHPAPSAASAVALPERLSIPAIGVDSSLERLGLQPDHTLQPPAQWEEAGWYADGVRPGAPGPAVIAGHVDSVSGPAVFYRLRDLRPGALALVRLGDGRTLRFVVDTVHVYPKDRFPTAAVYGPTALPELRLITCTGDFDFRAHSYVDNLVVSAHLAS